MIDDVAYTVQALDIPPPPPPPPRPVSSSGAASSSASKEELQQVERQDLEEWEQAVVIKDESESDAEPAAEEMGQMAQTGYPKTTPTWDATPDVQSTDQNATDSFA